MQDLEIIVEALQKAVKFEVFNKMEMKSIQLSLEALTKELQPKEKSKEEEIKSMMGKSK